MRLREKNRAKRAAGGAGVGTFVYHNGTKSEIILPRPTAEGKVASVDAARYATSKE